MVRAGKFGAIQFAVRSNLAPYGNNSPDKIIWYGPINKTTAGGATMAIRVHGPTWGFDWVEYCEIHSRPHTGTTQGMAAGTVCVIYNHNPTLWLPATLNVNQTRCFMFIIGRRSRV